MLSLHHYPDRRAMPVLREVNAHPFVIDAYLSDPMAPSAIPNMRLRHRLPLRRVLVRLPMVLVLLFAFVSHAFADSLHVENNSTLTGSCGGNCPSGGCTSCPCGTTASAQSISTWCAKYSGWNQANCQCIMKAESAGNANAVNQNSGGSYDVGLWQINDINWSSCSGGAAPCDPTSNLNCAIKVWQWGGNTWKLWATCGKCNACSSK